MPISKIKENSLASGAITEANVGADIINAQTELAETANDADFILVYDTSASVLKKVLKSNFTLQAPTFSSVSPTSLTSGDGTGNYTIVITGTGFTAGSIASLLKSDNTGKLRLFSSLNFFNVNGESTEMATIWALSFS